MPMDTELIGTWRPDGDTHVLIQSKGYSAEIPEIRLHSDKSFQIVNMPDMWRTDFGEPNGSYENAEGDWEVFEFEDGSMILSLSVDVVNEEPIRFIYAGCSICQKGAGYTLVFTPHPDQYANLIFVK